MEAVQLGDLSAVSRAGFLMALKEGICHRCFLRDTDNRKRSVTPFLMSAENNMDPGLYRAPARADTGRGDGDCTGTRTDARETRPWAPVSLHRPLCHVPANIVRTVRCTAKPARGARYCTLTAPKHLTDDTRNQRQFGLIFGSVAGHVLTWLRLSKG